MNVANMGSGSGNVAFVNKIRYLINGTGKAWAWQSSAKSLDATCTYDELLATLENVGAFAPTGSIYSDI